MVLDSSAMVAVILREPGFQDVAARMAGAPSLAVGTPTLVETALVLSKKSSRDASDVLARFLDAMGVQQVPFGANHVAVAVRAFLTFGKGRHRASLNFGDCLTYATAAVAGESLLCTGGDFALTDLVLA